MNRESLRNQIHKDEPHVVAAKADALSSLFSSPGWPLFMDEMEGERDAQMSILLSEATEAEARAVAAGKVNLLNELLGWKDHIAREFAKVDDRRQKAARTHTEE